MNHKAGVRVLGLRTETCELQLEAAWFPGLAPTQHLVQLSPAEASVLAALLTERPFGALEGHSASIEYLSTQGANRLCGIRLSKSGSRVVRTLPVSASTYVALQRVLDTNIISEGYVPE
jgi:hypothetical protein